MRPEKISLTDTHGTLDGVYINAKENSPLIIIINGHNGFYNYGMFPYLQQSLAKNNISSFSFNFSHGGISGDGDYFEEIKKYEKNCMRLEVEDVMSVLHQLHLNKFQKHNGLFLLAHSLGGVPAIFSAKKAADEKISVSGLILLSTVKQLNFWPDEMINEWKQNKVYFKKNNRTKQLLPQGEEFLHEVLLADSQWNIELEIKKLSIPILIVHGDEDEAVPVEHGEQQFEWIRSSNTKSQLQIIPGATHTYNTKHPFENSNTHLEQMIAAIVNFIETNATI